MKVECFVDLTLITETSDDCIKGYDIWVITEFENLRENRECGCHLRYVAKPIDEDAEIYKVISNSLKFHFLKQRNSSAIVLHPHKGSQNLSKLREGRNRAPIKHAIEFGNRVLNTVILK